MVEGNMGKFESQIGLFQSEENSCLNACVLLRSESIDATPDPFTKFSFAEGLAKVKLERVC